MFGDRQAFAAECGDTAQSASTPDGECVWVEGCMPEELGSCREVDGCCDAAPAPDGDVIDAR